MYKIHENSLFNCGTVTFKPVPCSPGCYRPADPGKGEAAQKEVP